METGIRTSSDGGRSSGTGYLVARETLVFVRMAGIERSLPLGRVARGACFLVMERGMNRIGRDFWILFQAGRQKGDSHDYDNHPHNEYDIDFFHFCSVARGQKQLPVVSCQLPAREKQLAFDFCQLRTGNCP